MPDWSTERWAALFSVLGTVALGAKQVWDWARAEREEARRKAAIRAEADRAAASLREEAEKARALVQATARHDALEEWQKLYGERERDVAGLKDQNAEQQRRIEACERRHTERDATDTRRDLEVRELQQTVKYLKSIVGLKEKQ